MSNQFAASGVAAKLLVCDMLEGYLFYMEFPCTDVSYSNSRVLVEKGSDTIASCSINSILMLKDKMKQD